ncbi:PHP domain-containing protein [Marinilabilia sp.]
MSHWTKYPEPDQLLAKAGDFNKDEIPLTNGHLHTPYSFSAFDSVEQAITLASDQRVKVVGINDFNTVQGYKDWSEACNRFNLVPLFNIEMIGLNREDQKNHVKVNDPSNPGRTYISGKGITTAPLSGEVNEWLANALKNNNRQSEQMTELLNQQLIKCNAPFTLRFQQIKDELTKGQVRERHLVKALRLKVEEDFKYREEQWAFYKTLTGKDIASLESAGVENMLRGSLLKAGGPAFIPEDEEAYASVETIRDLILKAKGIPTYPFLGNALDGASTDFEIDLPQTIETLINRGFFSAEFITPRNSLDYLESAAQQLWDNGFLVTLGTEHNTPAMETLVPMAKGNTPISDQLQEINVKSVCILLAHQYLIEKTGEGWLDRNSGKPRLEKRDEFIKIGWEIIRGE